MLNIDELVINYINLNDQINKQIICVVSCSLQEKSELETEIRDGHLSVSK